jgi:hypothetical protein
LHNLLCVAAIFDIHLVDMFVLTASVEDHSITAAVLSLQDPDGSLRLGAFNKIFLVYGCMLLCLRFKVALSLLLLL